MSRRQTDLEPGVEPDTGEPELVRRAQRPSTHTAARHGAPARVRRPARPTAAPTTAVPPVNDRRPNVVPHRRRQLAVVALGAVDRARASIAAAFLVSSLAGGSSSKTDLTYSQFVNQVEADNVKSIDFNKSTGAISGTLATPVKGNTEFSSSGPKDNLPDTPARDHQQEGHRPQLRRRGQQHPRRHPAVGAAAHPDHRAVRLDEPTRGRVRWARS